MFEYLETLRAKPGHIRERIALGTAAATTAVVAAAWLIVLSASGTFTLAPSNVTASSDAEGFGTAVAETKSGFSSFLGAVGAYQSGQTSSGITVQTEASTTVEQMPTVLPF